MLLSLPRLLVVLAPLVFLVPGVPAQAQQPLGRGGQMDGLVLYQGSASLSGGGKFKASRAFLRGGGFYAFENGATAGIVGSVGRFNYDFNFSGNQPWEDVNDLRISVPVRFPVGGNATALVSPGVRWDYQSGASAEDGVTYGVFAGLAWQVSDRLTIGPALGMFTQIEDNDLDVFPALLLDWEITDRWSLTTGSAIGATQGPGLSLGYAIGSASTISLSARSEKVRFRLDGQGLAPGGVGEDQSVPVVLSYSYNPNPGVSLSVFAGAELNGQLTLDDASGVEVSRQNYDTAPVGGFAFRLRF